jgi:hypothetical protein
MRITLAAAAALAAALVAVAGGAAGTQSAARGGSLVLAVIGDTPYGPEQLAQFPLLLQEIDGDEQVERVLHVGDIKSGSTLCTDEYFAEIRAHFDALEDPIDYTPGDNEWTDCHRPNNGGYDPLERLAKIRALFFPGGPGTQAGYPENRIWTDAGFVFATVHAVGSNNNLAPWTNETPAQRTARIAEATARIASAQAWIEDAFDRAERSDAPGVVLAMQADTFATQPILDGFDEIVSLIGARAAAFAGPVLLIQGDTHSYLVDRPFPAAQNATRIVVEGETASEWLRLRIDPRAAQPFSWERVFVTPPARLLARAILPSDAYQPGPPSGAFIGPNNGVTPPFPGQPIPGFSAVLDAGLGEYWGMPDNGFGAKTNSGDFLLRLYRIRPAFATAAGGAGTVEILRHLQLRDPDGKVPFPLFRGDRLLTGADFDLESVRRAKDGSFWFGEEFGPFLLHTDATGKVLAAPVPLPGVQSPQNPFLPSPDAWTLPASRGFEGMAIAATGGTLYPVLEGALRTDPDPRRRIVNEFDLAAGAYTGRTWSYRTDAAFPNAVIGDFTALDKHRFVLIERDDDQGAQARQKKIYLVDLRRVDRDGYLLKQLVLDLLAIPDPDLISLPARAGELGVGAAFSFPLQSVESLEVLKGGRLLVANDNNYPGSDGRWTARDRPDDTELIVVDVPELR